MGAVTSFSSSIARIQSFAFAGIDAIPVTVEIQISSGLPAFIIVGLPDKTVGEAASAFVLLWRLLASLCRPSAF